jgi:hypothetical protein
MDLFPTAVRGRKVLKYFGKEIHRLFFGFKNFWEIHGLAFGFCFFEASTRREMRLIESNAKCCYRKN